jgi:malonyl-CoA/methylmalonyl-CoA synthetase
MPELTFKSKLMESFSKYNHKTVLKFYEGKILQEKLSYAELDSYSNRTANLFLNKGAKKGDRIILCLPKSLSFIIAYLAILKINAISVPLNPEYTKNELKYFIQDSQAKLAIVGPEQNFLFKQISPDPPTVEIDPKADNRNTVLLQTNITVPPTINIAPEDPALIIYTSGTTGNPKGAVLTHKNLICDALNIIDIWNISQADILCHALPLFHVHGLCFALNTTLLAGAETIMLNTFVVENVVSTLTNKTNHSTCTMFMAVPTMYGKLLNFMEGNNFDFKHLRLITSGSAPLLPKDFERITKAFGQEPVEREGMSETGMNFSNPIRGKKKPGSIGIPLPGLQVKIVDPNNFDEVNQGEIGEIWLKSPSIMNSYWQKPRETADAFVNGWFRTGDLGYVDEEGYYFLTDRIKHIIISGGENISPKEVENVINTMESVFESSIVGILDETWGEKIVAAVVPLPDKKLSSDKVISHCKLHLHPWKCPKQVVIIDELPRNTMGKVLKEKVKVLFDNL